MSSLLLRTDGVAEPREHLSPKIELMECTLRDGSYAIDFKFTERDTEVLAGVLAALGFKYIEVGHGFGLGAAQAGKGSMPATDEQLIAAAKRAAPDALIGSFFIPGIGTKEQMKAARAAGLDFIRVGYNAPEIETAYPYLTFAREIGLIPCLNFMKSYGITAAEFGRTGKKGFDAGAEVVYCVDSAGSMFPEDVHRYFTALRDLCDGKMGFHGHSNLQFAMANSVEAYHCGAQFIDTTLYGMGRSAGNVPTEIAVAVFSNLGVKTGIDLFELMDVAEEYMSPLMSELQMYDMTSVAMGYSQFHSSFLPKVAAAARAHGVELRRLLVTLGKLDPVNLDDKRVEEVASSLPAKGKIKTRSVLVSFRATGISESSISASVHSAEQLIDGMMVTCAKRNLTPALELVPTPAPCADLMLADLVTVDETTVVGRITYGSFDVLKRVLELAAPSIPIFMLDMDGGKWGLNLPPGIAKFVGERPLFPIHSRRIVAAYLEDVLRMAARRQGDTCLLICGSPEASLLDSACAIFRSVAVYGALPEGAHYENCWEIVDFSDRMHFDLGITVCMFLCSPSSSDAHSIYQLCHNDTLFVTIGHQPRLERDLATSRIARLDLTQAYRGQAMRCRTIANAIGAALADEGPV
jgi:4-hydroxy-2-oxovalerate aldolase